MSQTFSGGEAMSVMYQALRGLSARQRAQANNVANVNTPGYKAEKVDFETALQRAVESSANGSDLVSRVNSLNPAVSKSNAAGGLNGNNVNLDQETVEAQDTALRYQLLLDGIGRQFSGLRNVIREGR
jgi:flagellar basal-body rod protein FlgB